MMTAAGQGGKFSPSAFSLHIHSGFPQKDKLPSASRPKPESGELSFQSAVEEIRGYLVTARGTEQERHQHSQMLNRAILGFTEERASLLAIIQDQLTKKRMNGTPPAGRSFGTLAEAVFADVIGLSVLELILEDKSGLEEIQVIGRDIYETRHGKTRKSDYRFQSVKDLERIQQNLVLFNNDTINRSKKWAEVMLSDGSRVTLTGFEYTSEPTLTLRIFAGHHHDLSSLSQEALATMDESMKRLILFILQARFNMVVIGPTNSGKTNFIKACIGALPDHERIVTIETRRELMLRRDFPGKNVIEYEIDEEDRRHSGVQAFKLALRQSPQRICHAEIRDGDANIYVRACTRGHEGSMTSVHAGELEDVPDAITDMCMQDNRGMDPGRLRQRIAEYVCQIGFQLAIVKGKRKIVRISEIVVANGETRLHDLVRYDYNSDSWIWPMPFSEKAGKRIRRMMPDTYTQLNDLGVLPL